jgi:CRISPR-associated protein Cas2
VSEACLDYGLDRVQFSAFQGQMKRTHQKELISKVKSLLGKAPGKVQLIPLSTELWEQRLEVIHE